eukprot:704066-Hanusia_phi.AAC.1
MPTAWSQTQQFFHLLLAFAFIIVLAQVCVSLCGMCMTRRAGRRCRGRRRLRLRRDCRVDVRESTRDGEREGGRD